jgi:ATP-dependent helicase/DNAse subunit B
LKFKLKSEISIHRLCQPEAEAVFAAREILKFVRAGNRFRDCAVLVRNLENYHQAARADFRRYEIPIFSRPPRIRRASPARRTHAQRAAHRRFRLAAK